MNNIKSKQIIKHNDNKQNMMFKTNFNFKFGAGAQFIVSRNQILKRPKEFYLKLIKLLEYSVNPMEGYVIERFHKIIFNQNKRKEKQKNKEFDIDILYFLLGMIRRWGWYIV